MVDAEPFSIIDEPNSIDEFIDLPEFYTLYQNYPNPFNSNTRINYYLPKESFVELDIFNIMGIKIKSIVDDFQ